MNIQCHKCGVETEHTKEFFKSNKVNGKIYLEKVCKVCRNKGYVIAKRKRMENPEYAKKIIDNRKIYHKKHYIEKLEWYKARNIRLKSHYSKYKSDNYNPDREKIRADRRWTNPSYRINKIMSSQINKCVSDKSGTSWVKLVNYTLSELKEHLQQQFRDGMTWDNYGPVWHIDHVKPISHFKFTSKDDPEFTECWGLKNLQPLLKHENLSKGNRYVGKYVPQCA